MREKVQIDAILAVTDATLLHQGDCTYVRWVVSSGLMSDVLTTEEEEILLVSSLTTTQVVRTADMVGANAILIACGKPVSPDTISLAKDLGITLMRSPLPVFETNCRLAPLFCGES